MHLTCAYAFAAAKERMMWLPAWVCTSWGRVSDQLGAREVEP